MAKPVHKDSNDCSSSSLDLFLLSPTQSSFQKGKSIDYHPITSLSDGGPIEFKVSGSGKEFLYLARSYLNYSEGYTIIIAYLKPFEIGDNFDLKAEGTLSIDLVFKSPLAATINLLVYAEYDNFIEIDSNHNVIKDWSN